MTSELGDEEKEQLPAETKDLCTQWPVYRVEPQNYGGLLNKTIMRIMF